MRLVNVPRAVFLRNLARAPRPYMLGTPSEDAVCYLAARGCGVALLYGAQSPDTGLIGETEIQCLFNAGAPGNGRALIDYIVNAWPGVLILSCFDGFLPSFYGSLGFKEYARVPFDPALAPEGWPDHAGSPDVVFMRGE